MKLLPGDCLQVLPTLEADSIDSCVTDPPYHLTSIVKRFGAENAASAQVGKTGAYARASAGFMGKQWDGGDIAFRPDVWREVWRVLKPGGYLLAFGGTRGFHRMFCAIEDAGFEIRDCIMWVYGQGFPKSHNLDGDWQGFGTALKPSYEPICVARKPFAKGMTVAENVLRYGTGAMNIDACRVGTDGANKWEKPRGGIWKSDSDAKAALVDNPLGRWPANVIHDGSDEVVGAFPEGGSGSGEQKVSSGAGMAFFNDGKQKQNEGIRDFGDHGSAARFFYTAKADKSDRLGSKHPTVKPVDLMAYLCRLVTQPGGTVLDPFAGSGSTGMACLREGFNAVLIEREAEYVADIKRRLAHVKGEDAPLFAEAT